MRRQLKDLMSRDVKVISPDMTIDEAARTMRDGDFAVDSSEIQPAAEALAKTSEPS
ncbi:MAG: CBS domain-containing protein [Steroidobacteraceae bacterium]